jgi:hypothetical protein
MRVTMTADDLRKTAGRQGRRVASLCIIRQVERWLGGATSSPNEATKKAKLKTLLVQSATAPP